MSARPSFRLFQASRSVFRSPILRRRVQTAAEPNAETQANQSAFAKLWNSPVGPKTVHFWAPIMKWGIVLAGISDLARPVESLSLTQNAALMATGAIWTRWCLIIKPKNVFLATVNFFLFCVGATQVGRITIHNSSKKEDSPVEPAKEAVKAGSEAVAEKAGLKN